MHVTSTNNSQSSFSVMRRFGIIIITFILPGSYEIDTYWLCIQTNNNAAQTVKTHTIADCSAAALLNAEWSPRVPRKPRRSVNTGATTALNSMSAGHCRQSASQDTLTTDHWSVLTIGQSCGTAGQPAFNPRRGNDDQAGDCISLVIEWNVIASRWTTHDDGTFWLSECRQ